MSTATERRVRVAGVSFAPGYPRNLADLVVPLSLTGPMAADLVREPDNGYDLNAVAVHIEGRMMGHLPANVAAQVGPEMDAGRAWQAEALYVPVDEEHKNRPGLEIRIFVEHEQARLGPADYEWPTPEDDEFEEPF